MKANSSGDATKAKKGRAKKPTYRDKVKAANAARRAKSKTSAVKKSVAGPSCVVKGPAVRAEVVVSATATLDSERISAHIKEMFSDDEKMRRILIATGMYDEDLQLKEDYR